MIQYLVQENYADSNVITELGFPRTIMHLASSEDAQVREVALDSLLELAKHKTDKSRSSLSEEDTKLKQILQDRIESISLMSPEDLGASKEERQLVDSLWRAYFNEPSSLGQKGLLVLPGEDEPAPDVASKHFEPALRAWAANSPASVSSPSSEKKEAPLLLGLGPPSENSRMQ